MGKTNEKKKHYKKPEIRTEKIFETAALSCGKCTSGNPVFKSACNIAPRLS